MATNLRVGSAHAYQLYREVEPVSAYPRIDPQQPQDEYPQQQSGKRADKEDQHRRRFRAMRDLIDQLKKSAQITRVDYFTAETDLNDLGLLIAEKVLIEQLLELKIPLDGIDGLFQQIRQRPATPDLRAGPGLSEASNFFPVFVAGLSEYQLCFLNLQMPSGLKSSQIAQGIESEGLFVYEKNRLRLEFRHSAMSGTAEQLQLDIRVLIAISEIDEVGRRAILYQRPDQSFALYADKQINLSI